MSSPSNHQSRYLPGNTVQHGNPRTGFMEGRLIGHFQMAGRGREHIMHAIHYPLRWERTTQVLTAHPVNMMITTIPRMGGYTEHKDRTRWYVNNYKATVLPHLIITLKPAISSGEYNEYITRYRRKK